MATKINWSFVDSWLHAGADGVSIADAIGVHANTLYNRCKEEKCCDFCDYKAQKKAIGDDHLRVKQHEVAKSGNVQMLIHLGKQRLGQADRTDVTTQGERLNTPTFVINNEKSAEAMKKTLGLDR